MQSRERFLYEQFFFARGKIAVEEQIWLIVKIDWFPILTAFGSN